MNNFSIKKKIKKESINKTPVCHSDLIFINKGTYHAGRTCNIIKNSTSK